MHFGYCFEEQCIPDTSIKKFLLKNLRVKHTYIISTIIIAIVVVVIIMSPNWWVPFELCNTAIKEYYFKLFVTYSTCSLVSILALEVQQHMLKKVNNACPSLPFAHIKAMVNSDTTVFWIY